MGEKRVGWVVLGLTAVIVVGMGCKPVVLPGTTTTTTTTVPCAPTTTVEDTTTTESTDTTVEDTTTTQSTDTTVEDTTTTQSTDTTVEDTTTTESTDTTVEDTTTTESTDTTVEDTTTTESTDTTVEDTTTTESTDTTVEDTTTTESTDTTVEDTTTTESTDTTVEDTTTTLPPCEPTTTTIEATTTTPTTPPPSTTTTLPPANDVDVLFVQLDDASTDAWPYYMPNTAAMLAGEHWYTFTQAVVQTPLCGPSRATDLTAQTVDHHGLNCHVNSAVCPTWGLLRGRTVTKALANGGVRVGWYGKRTNWEHECRDVDTKGEGFPNLPGVEDDRVHYDDTVTMFTKYSLVENGVERDYSVATDPTHYGTYLTADLAANGITNLCAGAAPCTIVWNPQAPHAPGTPAPDFDPAAVLPGLLQRTPAFNEGCPGATDPSDEDKPWLLQNQWDSKDCLGASMWTRAKYQSSLQAVDNRLPQLVAQFLATSPERSKRIIFTSDHGLELGNHGHTTKEVPYEASLRIPLFIYDSDHPGGTIDTLVTKLDLTPTIYEWTGTTPLLPVDGQSLVPLYTGTASSWPTQTYSSHLRIQKEVWDVRPWHAIRQDCQVFTPCLKLVKYPASEAPLREGGTMVLPDEWELYDLAADPWELTNLLPNDATGYAGQPGWSLASPEVDAVRLQLEAAIAAGR